VKACQDHQETLLLDVYGELTPTEREAWERHLKVCPDCRRERERLHQLLLQLKEATPAPYLSPEKAGAMAEAILQARQKEGEKRWWKGKLWGSPYRFVPVMAVVCLMIVVFGWFSLRQIKTPSSLQTDANLHSEQQMPAKDLEVIRNLELLEEMEVLEKLVRVVDERNSL
jgi:predicted anti-sigma-YlaC factor YlaD